MRERIFSYFPGCSMATSAKESNIALMDVCRSLGIRLIELEDWNCCGSSSAHMVDACLADKLAMRNLSLVPAGRPLLIACPSCNLRLRHASHNLRGNPESRRNYRRWFGREADPDLEIHHFFEILNQVDWAQLNHGASQRLRGLAFAPYYGCMLARPPAMRHEKNFFGIMENILSNLGASPVSWGHASRCCGTFLSVVRPDIVTPMVMDIIGEAKRSRAECLVTACAMCHLNLEVRCTSEAQLPIFHFAELLSLAFGKTDPQRLMQRHLIDPRPLLSARNLL